MAMDWGLVRPGPGYLPENRRGLVSTALGAAHSLAGDGSVLMSSCSFLEVSLKTHLPPCHACGLRVKTQSGVIDV